MAETQAIRSLLAGRGRMVAWLLGLMILCAISEGIGLLMLVPLLSALGPTGDAPRPLEALWRLLPSGIVPLLLLFVALVAVRAMLVMERRIAAERFQIAVVDGMRTRLWSALLHGDWRFLATMRQSDNASLLLADVDRVGFGVSQLLSLFTMTITLGGIGIAALALAPQLALVAAAGGALVIAAYAGMRRRANALGREFSQAHATLFGHVDEGLGSLRALKSLGGEAFAVKRVDDALAQLRQAQIAYARDAARGQAALQIGGAALLALLVGYFLISRGLGALALLPMIALFARALPLLGQIQEAWLNWAHTRPTLARTLALIDAVEAAREPDAKGITPPSFAAAMTFDHVSVRYGEGRPALSDVSLVIPSRGLVALTGSSGAGKSTLADLIGGLLAPDDGRIRVDDQDLDGALRRAWRTRVAYVQQDPTLFAGTVRENLRWAAPGASDSELDVALAEAAADFVAAMPEGLDTRIGDGGRALSGGERQRLVLARALLQRPAVLILDEATSALDPASEALVAEAIAHLKQRLAVIVISHRGALLALADRTVSLDGGRIVASST